MKIEKRILALDFDGVIADSISECLAVARNAFTRLQGGGEVVLSLDRIDAEILSENRRLRNFIRSGEDYVYIQLALKEKAEIQNQDDFDRFIAEHSQYQEIYLQAFYRERDSFLEKHRAEWLKLNPLYPGMGEFLRAVRKPDELAVITTKRLGFVREILNASGIETAQWHMAHAVPGRGKTEIILSIMEQRAVPAGNFDFVDDQVDTLIKARTTGVNCHLAAWGYNNEDQAGRARRSGLSILSLESFYRRFASFRD